MGIRPHMYLVCGITDLRDYSITDSLNWPRRVPLPIIPANEELDKLPWETRMWYADVRCCLIDYTADETIGKIMDKALICGDSEYGIAGVIGYIVAELPYANDCLYALALIYPEFAEPGFRLLPIVSLEDDCSEPAGWLKLILGNPDRDWKENYRSMAESKRLRIERGWNYCWFGDYMTMYANATLWLFKQIGLIEVNEEDLRLFLYWTWG